MKITGFEQFSATLSEAQKALSEIDGEIGTVSFDPKDPASLESAIQSVESMIDHRLGRYASNPIVAPLIDQLKQHYRQAILDKAAAARLEGEHNGN